jgi:hypothetical protein
MELDVFRRAVAALADFPSRSLHRQCDSRQKVVGIIGGEPILHPQFRQIPGLDSSMVIIDFPYLRYRYLDGRDTALLENRQNNDEDLIKHEYLTECGLELLQSKPHALIKNWKLRG